MDKRYGMHDLGKVKQAVQLREQGMTYAEIAERLGVSFNAAWRWCYDGKHYRNGVVAKPYPKRGDTCER